MSQPSTIWKRDLMEYWSVEDENRWQEMLQRHPFLRKLHLRNQQYGPPRPAPWGEPKSIYPVPSEGETQ